MNVEIFKTQYNYEIEQTVLVQPGKMCAERGEYVRLRDYRLLEKRLEEAEEERKKIIEAFQYLHFQINQLDTGMNNYSIQRVLGLIKKSECFELCKKINLEVIAKRIEPTPGTETPDPESEEEK